LFILNFSKLLLWTVVALEWWVANICLQTKFGANRSSNCWDTPVYVFPRRRPRWRLSAILDLCYPNFGPSRRSPDGL